MDAKTSKERPEISVRRGGEKRDDNDNNNYYKNTELLSLESWLGRCLLVEVELVCETVWFRHEGWSVESAERGERQGKGRASSRPA